MLTTHTLQDAMEAYRKGTSLVQQEQYREAIPFLHQSAEALRGFAAEGHPAEHTLENGVTAMANALYHLGVCYERTGNIPRAITCFETAWINERFERSVPFRAFLQDLAPVLASCYERQLKATGQEDVAAILSDPEPVPDSTYRFPFSLAPEIIPYARLYELAPQRYQQFEQFYRRAKAKDARLRSTGSKTDEATMHRISIVVWSVIAAIWLVYGVVVLRTVTHSH